MCCSKVQVLPDAAAFTNSRKDARREFYANEGTIPVWWPSSPAWSGVPAINRCGAPIGRPGFVARGGRCLHYYFYPFDAELGLCLVRVPTWAPFRLEVSCNGHNGRQVSSGAGGSAKRRSIIVCLDRRPSAGAKTSRNAAQRKAAPHPGSVGANLLSGGQTPEDELPLDLPPSRICCRYHVPAAAGFTESRCAVDADRGSRGEGAGCGGVSGQAIEDRQ